jgi:hypothetical protein
VYLDEFDDRMLNLFLIPDIRKNFSVAQDYFGADLDRFRMSEYQKASLLRYLEKAGSKLVSTDTKIVDPIINKYVINTTAIVFDNISPEIITNDINNTLANYFIDNTRRKRIPKSDLVKAIENVPGVDSVAVTIVGENNERARKLDPNAALVGLDEFNDIIITNNQLPLIRGGFTDRHGNVYVEGISQDSLGAVNIKIRDIVPQPNIK